MQVYSASRDGSIILWDLADGASVRSWEVGQPLEGLAVVGSTGERLGAQGGGEGREA